MAPQEFPRSFVEPWKRLVKYRKDGYANEFPSYSSGELDALITTCSPTSLFLGTGHSIYKRALIPAIMSAKHSVHLVTCFWADSPSLTDLGDALTELIDTRSLKGNMPTLHMTIGFSSLGLMQKLLHTTSRKGCVYDPSQWPSLGLPTQETLRRGNVELTVKTLFFTPFSVMHPKFLIVDNTTAWVPSCNMSWERWLEGCIEVHGGAVQTLLEFHRKVWGTEPKHPQHNSTAPLVLAGRSRQSSRDEQSADSSLLGGNGMSAIQSARLSLGEVPAILLPSSHHRNPGFSFLPTNAPSSPPMTPLNAALLTLLSNAQHSISIITPNLTSRAAIAALLSALDRGVDVEIRTSRSMMLLEQIVTAGTTTSRCVSSLVKAYTTLVEERKASRQADAERQLPPLGRLRIYYYRPMKGADSEDEPVQCHFKMTLVDGEYVVFGSGNMDRASWWTSQELGLLLYVPGFVEHELWGRILKNRGDLVFPC